MRFTRILARLRWPSESAKRTATVLGPRAREAGIRCKERMAPLTLTLGARTVSLITVIYRPPRAKFQGKPGRLTRATTQPLARRGLAPLPFDRCMTKKVNVEFRAAVNGILRAGVTVNPGTPRMTPPAAWE